MNRRVAATRSRQALTTTVAVVALTAPLIVGASSPATIHAQPPAAAAASGPTFEVASVKINKSGDGRMFFGMQPGGRFTATNVTLRMLIRNAYQLQEFQMSGGPAWLSSDRFDIVAKGDVGPVPFAAAQRQGQEPGPLQLMLRALLAERFKLTVHDETKEMPIYALVLARSDGRLGPDLHRSETDCAAVAAAARGRGPVPPPGPPQPGERLPCGIRIGPGTMTIGGTSLAQFANSLSMFVGRIVTDRTGLTGNFDLNLAWTPDQAGQRPPGAPDLPPIDPNGPSIFTAVSEQLGLKLDSQRGPVSMLVIDRAEHPTEN